MPANGRYQASVGGGTPEQREPQNLMEDEQTRTSNQDSQSILPIAATAGVQGLFRVERGRA